MKKKERDKEKERERERGEREQERKRMYLLAVDLLKQERVSDWEEYALGIHRSR